MSEGNETIEQKSSQYQQDENFFLEIVRKIWDTYKKHGARSKKKTDCCHDAFRDFIEEKFFKKEYGYEVKTEVEVKSNNLTGKKRCDVVVYKNDKLFLIIPVKMVMTNYKQNKANYFESLIGEVWSLMIANPGIKIVPLNIFFSDTPYLSGNKIKNFEKITFEKDIKNYDKCKPLVYDVINYIFDVEHLCKKGETFDKIPINIKFSVDTPYRILDSIFGEIV